MVRNENFPYSWRENRPDGPGRGVPGSCKASTKGGATVDSATSFGSSVRAPKWKRRIWEVEVWWWMMMNDDE